jgi:GT2 family glycosyltransferase
MNKPVKFVILLPVHNRIDLTRKSLQDLESSLTQYEEYGFQIIVIDDGSTDGSALWIEKNHPEVITLRGDGNLWWSGAINLGAKFAIESLNTEYVILWNNDILFKPDYFETLVKIIGQTDEKTIIGSKIMVAENPHLSWSLGGFFNSMNGKYGMYGYYEPDSNKYPHIMEVDWLTGMGTIIPKNAIIDCGYWDQVHFPQYHGDSDFTYRAKLKQYSLKVFSELVIYNKVKNSGIDHQGKLGGLLRMMVDNRSKINIRKNFLFYKKYSKTPWAYLPFFKLYLVVFLGFFKWKIMGLWGRNRTY